MKRIARIENKSIEVIPNLTLEEIIVLKEKYDYIKKFKFSNLNFELFHSKYEEINTALKNDSQNILDLVIAFLNIYKTFLFHWEKLLKDHYGEDSEQVKGFLLATNNEYESYFSYRLTNILRNFLQHCGYFKIESHKKLEPNNEVNYAINISIQELLQDKKANSKLNNDEKKLDKINLLFIFTENINSLYRLNNIALNYHYDIRKLYNYCNDILKFETFISEPSQQLAFIEYENLKNKSFDGILMSIIDFKYLRFILNNITKNNVV